MRRRNKGIALIVTIFVLTLLTVTALNFSFSSRQGSASARNFKEETETYYAAITAYEDAVQYIIGDLDPQWDMMDGDGIFWVDNQRPSASGKRTVNGMDVNVVISDEESRLNINTISEPLLRQLFTHANIPDDEVQGLIDSIADWRDPDELHRLSGAESDYYENLKYSYESKNRNFDIPQELLLLKGFLLEYLYGGKNSRPILDLLTTYGVGVNINTASPEVLEIAGLGLDVIQSIMITRSKDFGGLRTGQPALGTSGLLVPLITSSAVFRIEVTASIPNSPQAVKIVSILKRTGGNEGMSLKTIYWKEGFEGSRT